MGPMPVPLSLPTKHPTALEADGWNTALPFIHSSIHPFIPWDTAETLADMFLCSGPVWVDGFTENSPPHFYASVFFGLVFDNCLSFTR